MTLRRRITLAIAGLLAGGYLVFAIVSLVAIERTLDAQVDASLMTLAKAVGQLVDFHHRVLSVDASDVARLRVLHGPGEHLAIFDHSGRFIYGDRLPPVALRHDYRFARTTRIHQNGVGLIYTWQSNEWVAGIVRTCLAAFALVALGLILLAVLFSRVLASAILDPVERIAALAEQIEGRDLSKRIAAQGNDELSRLCASFDRMLDRLEASFETERRFIADASHELRTPLAVIRAETDLALRRVRPENEYRAALQSIDGEVARLEALVDDLLDTMRDRAPIPGTPVDVAPIVTNVAERLRVTARSVRVTLGTGAPVVRGHAASIERALTAVLHNAVTHGGAGAVDLRVFADSSSVCIEIADDGPGFAQDALAHATDRFWRADSARSRGGTGLGLSIARVLVEVHGGRIELANASGGGAIVRLFFPAAGRPETKLVSGIGVQVSLSGD
ncbi:MAG TPA: HAMP domain-containing sensor histidine kinase [Candidatus Acidoferrales bacterium]|nr:HAMP domain-containing sensor histidine kinase [Candidatus Acidoferrales bacterium]